MSQPHPALRGILNLNKPIGITSRDVVDRVTRVFGRGKSKPKAGHAGTLDPLASGVLVVCIGAATRLIEYVQRMPKTYRAVICLGATSNTLDADGEITETLDPRIPSRDEVERGLTTQVGLIDQMPPEFSALKIDGQRAYDLARAGESVTLKPRPVSITRVELIRYEWPLLEIEVDCGSGTYIRSIARDLGELYGCGGLIQVLTRTRIGEFKIEDAIDTDSLTRELIAANLRPAAAALGDMPQMAINSDQNLAIVQGREIAAGADATPGEIALVDADGGLVAIAEVNADGSRIAPRRVFN